MNPIATFRQHAQMRMVFHQDIAGITAGLNNDTIHVWLFDYQRAQRREPLRKLLGIYLGLPMEEVVLVEGEHGRPELAQPWNRLLQFNWSHSGDKAVIAVARGITPGVDIESVRARPRATQLAERYFHPEEVSALSALGEWSRDRAFLQLWTGKEAVLKALGRGVAFGLHRLRLSVTPAPVALLWLDEDDVTHWQVEELNLGTDHVASVAWRGVPRSIDIWTLAGGF